jgi:Cu(I)/Ag(I) efflux system membrane fusion protein
MKRSKSICFALLTTTALLLLLWPGSPALADEPGSQLEKSFSDLLAPYEKIRQALLNDTLEGVHAASKKLAAVARETDKAVSNDEQEKIFAELIDGATRVAKARELEAARDGFYTASKAMVRLRGLIQGETGIVAFCPMLKRSWVQPAGELGNPYYGQEMPVCGTVVD